MDRVESFICECCNSELCGKNSKCVFIKDLRIKFSEIIRSFLPDRKPVIHPGDPCEWNDCLDEIEKNIKSAEGK